MGDNGWKYKNMTLTERKRNYGQLSKPLLVESANETSQRVKFKLAWFECILIER